MRAALAIVAAAIVAPLLARGYAMFRSIVGTCLPFAAIFLASWIAGLVM
jgi:hypothetical protein